MTSVRRRRAIALRRWAIAVAVYLVAVFHRTSLGVAGLQAASRFGISPSQLSIFILLQLGIYAGMQIPTGILVDRYGPRRLLVVAAGTMGVAQVLFAVADSYPLALLARAVLGLGDALTFVSVLRFAAGQFAPRRYPVVVALTGTLGQLGNLVATLPLTALLHRAGWTPTFLGAGLLSLVSGAAVYLLLPRAPRLPPPAGREAAVLLESLRRVGRRVGSAWSLPGTRAGFWVHFASMATSLTFAVLWGVPFMVQGQGMSRDAAGTVLLFSVLVAVLVGPPIGYLIGRYPATRVPLAIGTSLVTVLGWYAVLAAFSGPDAALAAGGPGAGDQHRRPGVLDRLRAGPRLQRPGDRGHRDRPGERGRLRGRDRGVPGPGLDAGPARLADPGQLPAGLRGRGDGAGVRAGADGALVAAGPALGAAGGRGRSRRFRCRWCGTAGISGSR